MNMLFAKKVQDLKKGDSVLIAPAGATLLSPVSVNSVPRPMTEGLAVEHWEVTIGDIDCPFPVDTLIVVIA